MADLKSLKGVADKDRKMIEEAEILLGPDVNIHRSPLGGRDAESFSEDPYLTARLAVNYILGLQGSEDL